jgi:hypothetical protein
MKKSVSWKDPLFCILSVPPREVKFRVEYSPSNKSICQYCNNNIVINEVRLVKMIKTPKFFHMDHFSPSSDLQAWQLDGFEKLKKIDQRILSAKLKQNYNA